MTEAVACACHHHLAYARRLESGLELLECQGCGLYARRDLPAADRLAAHYRTEYWVRYATEQTTDARANVFRHVMKRVREHHPREGSLLDVGCGPGLLLDHAGATGWSGVGIEPSMEAARIGQQAGRHIIVGEWPEIEWPDQSTDAVVFLNVLDHLRHPVAAMQAAWRVLRPDGVVYLRVPNGPFHVRLLAHRWPTAVSRLSVFHLYGFGAKALRTLLNGVGFVDVAVRTAPLSQQDAYVAEACRSDWSRRITKAGLAAGYRVASAVGLDRYPWGPSLEAIAVKRGG
ncbi:hypothetical protein YTPLAS18_21810 [Nitrospira sp.]|nr:hypothetical protein YTPLAS18_21810 [Nitrospira sp.]